jgi:sec-independent protein translocase protein TatB
MDRMSGRTMAGPGAGHNRLWAANRGRYHEISMHFYDSIFIFLLALVLFGPKKLPEIGRQVGKLLAEFRRASNEFKFQIQEEMRNMEEDERRKKLAERQAAQKAGQEAQPDAEPDKALLAATQPAGPTILPPSTGEPVATSFGYSYPGKPDAPGYTGPGHAEAHATPPEPAEQALTPEAAIAPEPTPDLTPEPAAAANPALRNNGAHPSALDTPAPEVAHHD